MQEERQAERLREAMVARLLRAGTVPSGPIESALRTVPRHVFVPEAPLRQAYADTAVVTKRTAEGELISSVSQPTMVAIMLAQLQVRRGDRVLEIGAGGGYNAALLDELVGPDGAVTTVDIEPDVVDDARAALAAAGRERVRVMCADGAEGYPPDAPYDRLIVTAGAADLAPAWSEQLTAAARMVVPLTVCGSTRNVALVRTATGWRSESVGACGFIALRGPGAPSAHRLPLGRHTSLRLDSGSAALRARLAATNWAEALRGPAVTVWTGVALEPHTSIDDLQLYLALTGPGGYGRLDGPTREVLAEAPLGEGRAVVGAQGFAYLVGRPASPRRDVELGISGYGAGADRLVADTARGVARWADRHRAAMARLTITAVPTRTPPPAPPGHLVESPHHRIYLAWPGWDDTSP